jgi:DNA-binding NarL/FixJ family response regulator
MIAVGIIDDHPVARWGLEHLFSGHQEVRIAASVSAPGDLGEDTALDVVIIDLYLRSDTPALAAIRALAARHHVLVMSASGRQADVLAALRAGAEGYLTKDADDEEVTSAVRTVAAGGFYLSDSVANFVQADLDQRAAGHPLLSPREEQALSYIARGFTHGQTASRMNVKPTTIDSYIERIRRKLGLGNKADLTRMAIELRLTDENS